MNDKLPAQLIAHINVKLALIGSPPVPIEGDAEFTEIVSAMAGQSREKDRLLGHYLCPVDQRIQTFLYDYLQNVPVTKLPARTFVLDRPGLARILSLPLDRDEFHSDIISSYRVKQGVLHNPRSDRRTTQGIFHVTEGGLPIPDDKLGVPKITFAKMLALALNPPRELMTLPFTSTQPKPAECFVSLLLRPLVCHKSAALRRKRRWRSVFFVPGNLVSNLDFVESIFGNGGDPLFAENDSALDAEHWTGHLGCVILAPHLVKATKKAVGLPHFGRTPNASAAMGCAGKPKAKFTTMAARLNSPAVMNRASSSPSSPTTISVIAKRRSRRRDQLRGESVRPVRRGTRRRCAGVPELRPGRGIQRRCSCQTIGSHVCGSRGALRQSDGHQARSAYGVGTKNFQKSSTSRMTRTLTCSRNSFRGRTTASNARSNCSRTKPMSGLPATKSTWKSRRV